MSASHTPNIMGGGPSVEAHTPSVEVRDPCASTAATGSRRPVPWIRLHIGKGMAVGELRGAFTHVNQACQFLHRGKPPSHAIAKVLFVAMFERKTPSKQCWTWSRFLGFCKFLGKINENIFGLSKDSFQSSWVFHYCSNEINRWLG